jgi:hypothetical protein
MVDTTDKPTGKRDTGLYTLAFLVMAGFFAVLITLVASPTIATTSPAILILLGGLVTSVSQVLGFFFGSSRGSQSKDKTIAKITG